MVRCAAVILALATVFVVLTPSSAWGRRRRRRRYCYPVHCSVSRWSGWSPCSRSCGGGLTTRTRWKTRTESCGGGCAYHLRETRRCNTNCCPVNCVYSWSSWSKCSGCGMSSHSRTPVIRRSSSCGGRACPVKQTKTCNTGV